MTRRQRVASVLLLLAMVLQTYHGRWIGDFWEHSAVVRELAAHPLDPRHPLLDVDVPHAFFSPYHLTVAVLARAFALSSIDALAIAGILNLLLLLFGLQRFLRFFFSDAPDALGFYALLLVVFLWPSAGWMWSGFIGFNALTLGNVLPYPSTFAMATTFWILPLFGEAMDSRPRTLLCGLLVGVVLLTHPPTALFTVVALTAVAVRSYRGEPSSLRAYLLVLGVAAFVALLWPYYPFRELITANNPRFHQGSVSLYRELAARAWPLLLALPLAGVALAERLARDRLDAIALMLAFSAAVYGLGYATGLYGAGRIVSFVAILIQILAAAQLAAWESRIESPAARAFAFSLAIASLLAALQLGNAAAFERVLAGVRGSRFDYDAYEALADPIGPTDLVLTDLQTSWRLPSFAGKVVGSLHPLHWIEDEVERSRDLQLFFAPRIGTARRSSILRRYRPDYVLVNKRLIRDPAPYEALGERVHEDEVFLLLVPRELPR